MFGYSLSLLIVMPVIVLKICVAIMAFVLTIFDGRLRHTTGKGFGGRGFIGKPDTNLSG